MGKAEIEMRIKYLEAIRKNLEELAKAPNADMEKSLKMLEEIDMRIALLYQKMAEL